MVLKIAEEVPGLRLNAWFLDDGTLVGTREELELVVDILERDGPARGLVLSTSRSVKAPAIPKSSVWCPRPAGEAGNPDPLGRGIPQVLEEGIVVLGAPIGSRAFVQQRLRKRVDKVRDITALLPDIKDPHTEFVILRSCLSLPKIMFSLRTVDTSTLLDELKDFDSINREAVSRIMGPPLSDQQWEQAKLPVHMGGLGIRGAEDHGPVAYAVSYLSSRPLVSKLLNLNEEDPAILPQELLDALSNRQGEDLETASLVGVKQKAASLVVDQHNLHLLSETLTREGSVRETARLASLGLAHAGDWLNLVPCPALGLHLRPAEFTAALKYRLGVPMYDREGPCPACGRPSDTLGDHALCCGSSGERIARHNSLRDTLYQTAIKAALGPVREGRALIPGSAARPADVFIPRWSGGRDAALDVTVIHPLQSSTVAGAAVTAGHALTIAYDRKVAGAAEACSQAGIAFIPLAVESLGGWHPVAVEEVKRMASALARHKGEEDEGKEQRELFQLLALLVQKGNAALFNNRVPDDGDAGIML